MTDHRYTGNRALVRTDGQDVEPGERFEPRESELKHFGNHIEVIEEQGESVEESKELPYDEDEHWQTIKSQIDVGTYDDSLDLIIAEDDRQSIVEAAKDRQETIEQ